MSHKFILLLLFFTNAVLAQLTVKIGSIPYNTPLDEAIFMAGTFNNWNAEDSNYKLTKNNDGTFEITISPAPGTLKFKFTRGSWNSVEGNTNGGFLPDREIVYNGSPITESYAIFSWEDLGSISNSTAASNVHILDNDFYIPQLDRNRRIWIYLPPDYNSTNKYYPVLYMHDGQNLFDQQTSLTGEWEVDESLNELFENGDHGAIVIGIENGGVLRIDELSPWYNGGYDAGGEGGAYVNFIVETLKPYVDANFRTLQGRDFTCIFGSSLGGLVTQYGIMEHQDVFAKAGVFSPAFWFNPEVFEHSGSTTKTDFMKVFMLAGELEGSGSVVNDVNQMEEVLLNNGFASSEFKKEIHTDGQHSEWYWAREFPAAYEWLFDGLDLTSATDVERESIRVYPNPADAMLFFDNFPPLKKPIVRIYSMDGKLRLKQQFITNFLDISSLERGVYVLRIQAKHKFRFTEKIIVH